MTPQEYDRLRLDRPDLALPHLSEFAGQLWSRLVSEILPPLSPEDIIVAVMTDRLLNGVPQPPKRSNSSRIPCGRTADGSFIHHRRILSYPLLEDLQPPSPSSG